MPLSEHEQRLLDQIERALYDEDPKFASTVRSTDLRTHMRRRMIRAAALFVVGFVMLPTGVVLDQFAVGIVGFILMIGAMVMAMSAYRRLGSSSAAGSAGQGGFPAGGRDELGERRQRRQRAPRQPGSGSFRQRVEQRWQRRMDERGGEH